eukprot:33453-Pelagomonas_calceolata.AAC.2
MHQPLTQQQSHKEPCKSPATICLSLCRQTSSTSTPVAAAQSLIGLHRVNAFAGSRALHSP